MQKMKAYASSNQPEITAAAMDFSKPIDEQGKQGDKATEEIMKFPTQCHACAAEGECKMCVATIPYFKEIIIMAFACEYCGQRLSLIHI